VSISFIVTLYTGAWDGEQNATLGGTALFAVLLRGVSVRFTAILLRGIAQAVLLRGIARVVLAQLNTVL
jgi:hypothetical protein